MPGHRLHHGEVGAVVEQIGDEAAAHVVRREARNAGALGFAMIGQTWPRSALYVLCPPLALSDMNYICPSGGVVFHFILTAVLTLVGLVAKGAIAVFYLRERGSYSEDGAAYITAQDEPAEVLAGTAADHLTHPSEAPTVSS